MDFELSLYSETVAAAHPVQPLAVTPDTPIKDVLQLMRAQSSGSVLICDDGKLSGVFTERDALKVMASGSDLSGTISEIMSTKVESVHNDATVGEVIQKMSAGKYRRLPIVDDDGKPVGVQGSRGIIHYLVEHFPEAIYNLPPEPSSGPADREGA